MNCFKQKALVFALSLLACGCGAGSTEIPPPDKAAPPVDKKVDEARIQEQMEMMKKSTGSMPQRPGQPN
jgi:predicted small lipoprotein YifL